MFRWKLEGGIALRLLQMRNATEVFARVDADRAFLRVWLPWVDHHRDVADTKVFIREALEQFVLGEAIHVGIWYEGAFAGVIGYHRINTENRLGEIGYWLGEAYQGKGIMTRACRAMVAYGFSELKLNRIEIHCALDNTKSRAVPERLGFKEEGLLRQAERVHDRYVDNVVYGMVASEYDFRFGIELDMLGIHVRYTPTPDISKGPIRDAGWEMRDDL